MEWLEDWKGLILKPRKAIPKRAGTGNWPATISKIMAMVLISATAMTFSPESQPFRSLFGAGQREFFAGYCAVLLAAMFAGYWIMHAIARKLGGKWSFSDLMATMTSFSFPISFISLGMFLPSYLTWIAVAASCAAGLASLLVLFNVFRMGYGLSSGAAVGVLGAYFLISVLVYAFIYGWLFGSLLLGHANSV